MNDDIPLSIFNLVIKMNSNDEVLSEFVYRYKMDPEFGVDYYSGDVDFREFSGETQIFTPNQIFESGRSNPQCINDMESCCIRPSGGGGTQGGSNPGSGGSGGVGGSGSDGCIHLLWCRSCIKSKATPHCEGKWHSGCICNPPAIQFWTSICRSNPSGNTEKDCCPGASDEIPMNPGLDPSTVGDEDTGPIDFTEELQAGLNSANFINDFLGGDTNISRSSIVDAAECANCPAYSATDYTPGEFNVSVNNYNQCVLSHLLNNAPCTEALTVVEDFDLSAAQQLNLVGPGGFTGPCAPLTANFAPEVLDFYIKQINPTLSNTAFDFTTLLQANNSYLLGNKDLLNEVINFLSSVSVDGGEDISHLETAISLFVEMSSANLLTSGFSDAHIPIFTRVFGLEYAHHAYTAWTIRIADLKLENPNWETDPGLYSLGMTALFDVIKDDIHLALDVAGLVPVIGEVFDFTNAFLYARRMVCSRNKARSKNCKGSSKLQIHETGLECRFRWTYHFWKRR